MADTAALAAAYRSQLAASPREPAAQTARRHAALARFATLGPPQRKQEAWRFSDVSRIVAAPVPPAPPPGADALAAASEAVTRLAIPGARRLTFLDGYYVEALSDGDPGLRPLSARLGAVAAQAAAEPDGSLAALAGALHRDGFALTADGDATRPAQILLLTSATDACAIHIRGLVDLPAGAAVTLIETHAALTSSSAAWTNLAFAASLDADARLDHVRLQDLPDDALFNADGAYRLADRADLSVSLFALGGKVARDDVDVIFSGADGKCRLDAALRPGDGREATLHSRVTHNGERCETRQTVKAAADGTGHAVALGMVAVTPRGKKTDARQSFAGLLLSDRARIDAKPELEILADDVKCAHGAAIGALDEAALFYLRSRGLSAEEARALLIDGFFREAVDALVDPGARALAESLLAGRAAAAQADAQGSPQ